jgi:exonuclease III
MSGVSDRAFLHPKNALRIALWNVLTLNAPGRAELLAGELSEFNVDIAVLSETRLIESGESFICSPTGKRRYKLFHSGGKTHNYGVGFAIRAKYANCISAFNPISDRIATIELDGLCQLTIVAVYAPTDVKKAAAEKDSFYALLNQTVARIPAEHAIIVAGDFNAVTGRDNTAWQGILGPHGVGNDISDNGRRMLSFAGANGLLAANSWFRHKRKHQLTFYSNDQYGTVKQLDHMLVSKRFRTAVEDVKVNCKANVLSDHRMVSCKVRLHLKVRRSPKRVPARDYDVLRNVAVEQYHIELSNRFEALQDYPTDSVEPTWHRFRSVVTESTNACCPTKRKKTKPWISNDTLKLHSELKEGNPDNKRRNYLKREIRRKLKADKDVWWNDLAHTMQVASDRGDSRTLFNTVRVITGQEKGGLPSTLVDASGRHVSNPTERLACWAKHFSNLYNRPNPPNLDSDLDSEIPFPNPSGHVGPVVSTEAPSAEEVRAAIAGLKIRKAPGPCGITAESLKALNCCGQNALLELLQVIWSKMCVPEDFRNSVIVPVFKKGSKRDCTNYRGISLLSTPGKVLTSIIRSRLRERYEFILRDQQAGFRSGRGCADQIFVMRQCVERRLRHGQPTVMVFIDFAAAFDSVHRESLWSVLRKCGVPELLVQILRDMYSNAQSCVRANGSLSTPFEIQTGVRQGCVLSPMLFNLVLDWILAKSVLETDGVILSDSCRLADVEYADDIATLSEDAASAQKLLDCISHNASLLGLKIKPEKSKVMYCHINAEPRLTVNGTQLECVECFTYLGSAISSNKVTPTEDIAHRIAKASQTFGRLHARLWRNGGISLKTKMKIYNAAVISTLLYGSESWCLNKSDLDSLEVFQMSCLRSICGISLRRRIRSEEIRRICSDQPPVQYIIRRNRLRWLGHVARMAQNRVCHALWSHPIPAGWKCTKTAPKNTWDRLNQADLEPVLKPAYGAAYRSGYLKTIIKDVAQDRNQWRQLINSGRATTAGKRSSRTRG